MLKLNRNSRINILFESEAGPIECFLEFYIQQITKDHAWLEKQNLKSPIHASSTYVAVSPVGAASENISSFTRHAVWNKSTPFQPFISRELNPSVYFFWFKQFSLFVLRLKCLNKIARIAPLFYNKIAIYYKQFIWEVDGQFYKSPLKNKGNLAFWTHGAFQIISLHNPLNFQGSSFNFFITKYSFIWVC